MQEEKLAGNVVIASAGTIFLRLIVGQAVLLLKRSGSVQGAVDDAGGVSDGDKRKARIAVSDEN